MTLNQLLLVYLTVHLILCALIWLALRQDLLHFSRQMMPMILLVPVFGILTAVAAEVIQRTGRNGSRNITLEDPHLEYADLRLHRIERHQHSHVIPIQEALRINDAQTRRSLILEVIRQDPKNYIQQLQEACSDSDLEVSHYASTTVMEVQREYELSTQQAETEYTRHPDDPMKLHQAIHCMQCYINTGLINASVLPAYRFRFAALLDRQMALSPEDMHPRLTAVENYLALENLTDARLLSDELIRRWPTQEQVWIIRLKVCYAMHDADGIRNTLQEISLRNIYLSPEGKATVQFWTDQTREGV